MWIAKLPKKVWKFAKGAPTMVWGFAKKRKQRVLLLVALLVFSQGAFYMAKEQGVSENNEYVQYAEAIELYQFSTNPSNNVNPYVFGENLNKVFDVLKEITNTPPFDSTMDAFGNFGLGTIIAKFICPQIENEAEISKCFLAARSYIILALRQHDDRDFTWNLEILNELAKQALMGQGYSEEEAENILENGMEDEQSEGDDERGGRGEPSEYEPPRNF